MKQQIALANICGLERAIRVLLFIILGEFIHDFVEVYSIWAIEILHHPIQCTFGIVVILYLQDFCKKWIQQYNCAVKISEHWNILFGQIQEKIHNWHMASITINQFIKISKNILLVSFGGHVMATKGH
jgi:hypothetical protein